MSGCPRGDSVRVRVRAQINIPIIIIAGAHLARPTLTSPTFSSRCLSSVRGRKWRARAALRDGWVPHYLLPALPLRAQTEWRPCIAIDRPPPSMTAADFDLSLFALASRHGAQPGNNFFFEGTAWRGGLRLAIFD